VARIKKLRSEHALELKAFLALSKESQKKLSEAVSAHAPTIAASQLLSRFVETLGDRSLARNVLRQLLFIAEYVRVNECTSTDALADIGKALNNDSQWTTEEVQTLAAQSDWISSLSDMQAVYGSAKALTLSFDTENSFSNFRVITDIRPVFDRSRAEIIGATIINDVRIEYSDLVENRSLSLPVSVEELKKIRIAVDDAISKSSRAQKWLEAPKPVPAFSRGEEKYGFD
jgi:hypothetical protein